MKKVICIMCPLGCPIEIQLKGKKIIQAHGNKCKEGITYARKEIFLPGRVLTTTIKTVNPDLRLLPVRSDNEVPKERLMDCMKEIANHTVRGPVELGEIVIKNVLGIGANIVACRTLS